MSVNSVMEKQCTLLVNYDKSAPPSEKELKDMLENGNVGQKITGLKKTILLTLNGEPLPSLLMSVIRYVVPTEDHALKKLTYIYFEVLEKHGADGKLLPEMILIGNALRNDLEHANEYIRGNTCRFLCKIKEPEILEALVPSLRKNLEHRHSFVRRNAVNAVFTLFRNFEELMPDGPELIEQLLLNESDLSARRNAFLMLFSCDQDRATNYLSNMVDAVGTLGDIFQLVVLELIRKVCRSNPLEKSKYIKCIFNLMSSTSSAVTYECACTLVSLSSSPTALRAAADCYSSLLTKESDNNVKLIVLERLLELKNRHGRVLQDMVMEIMRGLNSPNMDVRRKTLEIGLDLIGPRNIDEVMMLLKKEIQKTQAKDFDKSTEYRQMLISAIHSCAVKFPEVAHSVVHVLVDFVGDSCTLSAVDVITFVREIIQTYPKLRSAIIEKLVENFSDIKSSRVFRHTLWLIGEYTETAEEVRVCLETVKTAVGPLPLFQEAEEEVVTNDSAPATITTSSHRPQILADGTYASQSAAEESSNKAVVAAAGGSVLRNLLLSGDFFVGSVLSASLSKMLVRAQDGGIIGGAEGHKMVAEVMLMMTAIIRLSRAKTCTQQIDEDSTDRIMTCFTILSSPDESFRQAWVTAGRESYATLLTEKLELEAKPAESHKLDVTCHVDDLINVRQLKGLRASAHEVDDDMLGDLSRATGDTSASEDFSKRLARVTQLSGFSDPVYVEAVVTVHSYDISLDLCVCNRTNEPLKNVCLELATVGDLRLCERPQTFNLGKGEQHHVMANVKVSSTETGIIFGNLYYDAGNDRNCVILNDIHIDIMDYISPALCSDLAFRSMWAEFEWENKVAVNTNITDVNLFLEHIVKVTNMKSLTTKSGRGGSCNFLSSNLYARSTFGEDALVNLSIERQQSDGKIVGYIRIRSKTQGIALSLGDKITLKQKDAGS